MRCHNVEKLISLSLDGPPNPASDAQLREHLTRCSACCQVATEYANLSRILSAFPAAEPRTGFASRCLARLDRPRPWRVRLRDWLMQLWPAPIGLAAGAFAAGVLIVSLAPSITQQPILSGGMAGGIVRNAGGGETPSAAAMTMASGAPRTEDEMTGVSAEELDPLAADAIEGRLLALVSVSES